MFVRWSRAIVSLLLLSGAAWAEEIPNDEDSKAVEEFIPIQLEDESPPPTPPASRSRWANLVSLEATTWTLLPRRTVDGAEGFLQVAPKWVVARPGVLHLGLGAPVRLRMWGGGTGAGRVRKEDWDTLSDWGQVVRILTVGGDAPNSLWMGALESYTLLSGHLVRRYNNRGNPNYHPAGAVVTGLMAPVYVEAFASDVLGARLMGAEVVLDAEHLLFGRSHNPLRYMLSMSAVHDWGKAGGASAPMTLAHLDGTAILVRRRNPEGGFELQAMGGWGGRPGEGGAWGAVVGLGVESVSSTLDLRARLEGRLQRGGFRQGAFGPDYELARFQVAGPSALPQADAPFPDGASAHGEVILTWDAEGLGVLGNRHFRLTLGAEAFNWGRMDAEGRLEAQVFHRNLTVAAGGMAMGMGQPAARYLASSEVRWRFLGGALYAVGQGGTLLSPTPEGTLRPEAFVAVGLGVDHVR
ncbi:MULTISPECIES: hypothetical protein [unclassified Corallococcus]|uniref:hypothetical protein n=1 Tax=unclassified Corallococcus TaxID=2685029 RepID=UPI001A8EF02F|nr:MULTISPECIES: hypothetical protein [unclassified Corallococcus]MBN9685244.1 hypothetical protein [Corallococcus sp. NCSPR001]WAS83300.1 hypothetical protein O0N60_28785 [Corallococcus sp. NCRR]